MTTEGTPAAPLDQGGLVDTGFVRSDVIDPLRNGGRAGAVSVVLLGLLEHVELPVTGTGAACVAPHEILEITVSQDSPQEGCCDSPCTLTFTDRLAGDGQPVENLVGWETDPFSLARPTLKGTSIPVRWASELFQRGDAGADGETTISDTIRILDFLFTGDTVLTCKDAADVDDGGEIDITDPIRLLGFLFLGEVEIPPPTGACSIDPTASDGLDCRQYACP